MVSCQREPAAVLAVQCYTQRLALMTPSLQNALERDDSLIGTWNPKLLKTCTALQPVASDKCRFNEREIEKFIIRLPPIGENDDYDSENSWISDGLPSSSRRRRRGDGRWEVGGGREK